MSKGYAILLRSDTPEDLLSILDGYIRQKDSLKYILSKSIDIGIHFIDLEVIRSKDDNPWKLSIPTHVVVAIADLESEPSKFGFGP